MLVIDKPAGMVVHPAPGHISGTLVNALLAHVPNLELDMGDEARPGIVHRLDKDTSGLLVVAKRRAAHDALTRQMSKRTMHKEYIALVDGHPRPPEGIIDAPIARDPRDRHRMAVVAGGRTARTHYRVERDIGRYSLVQSNPRNGQNPPDQGAHGLHGPPPRGRPGVRQAHLARCSKAGAGRQFLHAHKLGFTLPSSGEWREFVSELPEDLRDVLERLGG